MAQIHIDRPSSGLINRWKPCEIYVDGKMAGSVANGEERYFEVGQGEHTVSAKIAIDNGLINLWVGQSPEVLVAVKCDETKKVKVSGKRGELWMWATILIGGAIAIAMEPYFSVDKNDRAGEKLYFMLVCLVVFALSFFAYGKKNYLTLTLEE